MDQKKRFKPLWMIHNRVYRQYAKGAKRNNLKRYLNKIKSILKLKR